MGGLANAAVVLASALLVPQVSYLLTNLLGIAMGSGLNFLLNLKWTWGLRARILPPR